MENNNINTNVAQIILPPDMELRKVKKPRPKTSSEKKKILKQLKETLLSYDTALSVAKSKNINIPAEIGMLPNNIGDINSVKELKELTSTLLARIQTINQLIAQGSQQQRTNGLFSEGMGGQRIPVGAPYQPQAQPQVLPSGSIFPSPVQPIVPSTNGGVDPTQVPDTDAENTLDQLRQEILNKLSPEDRATAEAELEKERQQPETPVAPQTPEGTQINPPPDEPQSPNVSFETLTNFDIGGGKTETITAPIGWGDIYSQYRQYMEGLTQKLVKMDKGIFELPAIVEQQLNQTRNDILQQHDNLLKSLTLNQTRVMDTDASLSQLDKGMINELTLDPKDIIKQIAKSQNIPLEQITSGITKTEEGLQGQRTEAAKQLLNQLQVAEINNYHPIRIQHINESKKSNNIAEVKLQAKQVQDTVNSLREAYNNLSGVEQASIEFEYQSFLKKMMDLEVAIQRVANEDVIIDPEGNVKQMTGSGQVERIIDPSDPGEPQSPKRIIDPSDPSDPSEPQSPKRNEFPDSPPPSPKSGEEEEAISTRLTTGQFTRIPVSKRLITVLSDLSRFASGTNTYLTQGRYDRITEIANSPTLKSLIDKNALANGINDLPPLAAKGAKKTGRNQAARDLVRKEILDKILVDVESS